MIEKICHVCKTGIGQRNIEVEVTDWNNDEGSSDVYYFHKKCYKYDL